MTPTKIDRLAEAGRQVEQVRAHLAAIVESSNDAIIGRTLDGIIMTWNKGAEKIFGYSAEEAIGSPSKMLIPAGEVDIVRQNFERIRQGERLNPYETVRLRKDGKAIHVSITASPVKDESGKIIGISAIMRDFTERKRAEDDLRNQKEILQKIFDNVPAMINLIGADGRIKLVNREWEQILGWTLEEIQTQDLDILAECYPDPQDRQAFLDFVATPEGNLADFKTRTKDGRVIDTAWANLKLSDGTTIGIGKEVTERRRAENRMTALHDINLAMTSTLDLSAILQILLEKIDLLLPYAAAHIRLIDKSTGTIEPVACRNIDEPQWKAGAEAIQHSIHRTIVQSKGFIVIRNLQKDEHVSRREFYRQQGLASYLGVPLIVKGEVIGILSLFTKDEHEFTQEEIDVAETLAKQASVAIHNSQLYEQTKKLSQDLLSNEQQIWALATGLMHAQDEEAKRIARALHDESGQLLANVYITLDETAKQAPISVKQQLEKAKKLLDRIEERLRSLSHELHPTILDDLGLMPSLEFLTGQISKRTGMNTTLEGRLKGRLSPLLELTLYRVVQEALNNIVRHAHATKSHVRLVEDEKSIQCSIQDNGIGFDSRAVSTKRGKKGLGLVGMRERVESLNGTFEILPAPGRGTKLLVTIPQERLEGSDSPAV